MLYMKACPRCHGDVKLDRDNYGVYAKCLQCGFNRDFSVKRDTLPVISELETPEVQPVEPVVERRRKAA